MPATYSGKIMTEVEHLRSRGASFGNIAELLNVRGMHDGQNYPWNGETLSWFVFRYNMNHAQKEEKHEPR